MSENRQIIKKYQTGNLLVTGEVYHIVNKSIAKFKIFNDSSDFSRMIRAMRYYQKEKRHVSFSAFEKIKDGKIFVSESKKHVEIISYCIMPTHIHLLLKQLEDKGISIFMNNLSNSYSRYFNLKHKRKGPLWEGRFKRVLIESDEQLLHLTRYIHLNPATAYIVKNPSDWEYSSYQEYLSAVSTKDCICKYNDILDINSSSYKEFVEDRIFYQRELTKIKHLILE